jgi:hypothetical protein
VAGNVHLGARDTAATNVATAVMLDEPWGLAIDSSGSLLIADFVNNRIRKVAFGKQCLTPFLTLPDEGGPMA